MAEPSNAPRRALRASEALLLEYLREHADPDGCAVYTKAELETALGPARARRAHGRPERRRPSERLLRDTVR
jgi:hypothetical protein